MNTFRYGPNEMRHWREQQEQARVATHRAAWSQDRGGYFAQVLVGETWENCSARVGSHADAVVDAKLDARAAGRVARMHPLIANLTPGRPEYGHDLSSPTPN